MADVAYAIWGSKGHAKVLAGIVRLRGGRVAVLFDNDPAATSSLPGVPLYIGAEGLARWRAENPTSDVFGVAAIGGGRGRDRLAIHGLFREHRMRIAEPLVHPHASICDSATLGPGSHVLAQAVVASDAVLGESCILNHHANVDHESVLGNGVHIAPGATLCGEVRLGDCVFIGAQAVVLPRISVGEGTVVGAGAVVTRDLPAGVVAVGNPARIIRKA